jgi:hypothetical protein
MGATKLTDAELLALLETGPKAGSRWVHYKTGNVYSVNYPVILESTQELLVCYCRLNSHVHFARPLREWTEPVEWEGQRVPRFRPA